MYMMPVPKKKNYLTVLSLGAGIQSTALPLLSLDGHLPPIDCAIFADTGWEPESVYLNLKRLSKELSNHGIPTYVVSKGNIRNDALSGGRFASIPFFTVGDAGRKGMARRQCTTEYKLEPIKEKIRWLLGAKPTVTKSGRPSIGRVGGRPGERFVEMWVGISTDEIERQRPADVQYIRRMDPLIDMLDMSRSDCEAYLAERWPWPVGRSACIGCPYHSDAEWRRMKNEDPGAFADAVDFDESIRSGIGTFKNESFLHRSRIPLVDVSFDGATEAQTSSCSPWGCRSEAST